MIIVGNKKTGFTLIELLVVTAIGAMILSVVFILTSKAKERARDARREEDIKQIQNALNLYQTNLHLFPQCPLTPINGTNDCLSAVLIQEGLIMGVPTDPLGRRDNNCGLSGNYVYCYESTDGFSYNLMYNLETDSVPGKQKGWQTVNP
jgi:prepilin-type N-terminal cleavage/methylation domain-containing protein